jgi:hypothetical protein
MRLYWCDVVSVCWHLWFWSHSSGPYMMIPEYRLSHASLWVYGFFGAPFGHKLEVVDSNKYLGVTLSEDLSWRKHVEATSSKASRTLGFMRRNFRDCNKSVREQAWVYGFFGAPLEAHIPMTLP